MQKPTLFEYNRSLKNKNKPQPQKSCKKKKNSKVKGPNVKDASRKKKGIFYTFLRVIRVINTLHFAEL